jgi:adenosylhomocysteine nucleosidase
VTPLLILTAVELEARALARGLELQRLLSFPFPAFGRDGVRVAAVGLAAVLCGKRWASLIEGLDRPLIVSAGLCGGLDPGLKPADLVIPDRVLSPDGELHVLDATPGWAAAARVGQRACGGLLLTTQEVLATPAAKAARFAESGAVAVDMESALIVARATAAGCRALVVRAVSDSSEEGLPMELVRLLNPDGTLELRRALTATISRPAVIRRTLALRRRAYRGLRVVGRVLAAAST